MQYGYINALRTSAEDDAALTRELLASREVLVLVAPGAVDGCTHQHELRLALGGSPLPGMPLNITAIDAATGRSAGGHTPLAAIAAVVGWVDNPLAALGLADEMPA